MAVSLRHERDNIYRVEIRGTLRKQDLDAAQQSAAAEIRSKGRIRLLIVLDAFEGWQSDSNWRDLSFFIQHDRDIERIAIVGAERWRSEALMFAAADLRKAVVEYFPTAQGTEALSWLAL